MMVGFALVSIDMHSLVRLYVKTAIAFLVAGLLLGGYLLARRELFGVVATPYEISAHTHVILVGFVMTMILGVALWLFPRPAKDDVRYRPGLAVRKSWRFSYSFTRCGPVSGASAARFGKDAANASDRASIQATRREVR